MKLARIAFIVLVALLISLSISALNFVHRNRLTMDRNCIMYSHWLEFDRTHPGGAFGPIPAMESYCNGTWLAWLNRKTEWEMPWR